MEMKTVGGFSRPFPFVFITRMLRRTEGHRRGVKVVVTGVRAIRQLKKMRGILERQVRAKGWRVRNIHLLDNLLFVHKAISECWGLMSDLLRVTDPGLPAAGAAPRYGHPTRAPFGLLHPGRGRFTASADHYGRPARAPFGLLHMGAAASPPSPTTTPIAPAPPSASTTPGAAA
ncbi:hypothetical protein ACP70R_010446 [Stipagrostis hirtigluma subsp. patula]